MPAPPARAADAAAAFQRWVDALNAPHDPVRLAAAVGEDIVVERHAPGPRGAITPIVETFAGPSLVTTWLQRTPPDVTFALVGAPAADGDHWAIEYRLVVGEFRNGGLWHARMGPDGRIAALAHRPDALVE